MHPLSLLPLAISLAIAWEPPSYPSWTLLWSDSFAGPPGTLPNKTNWNIIDAFPDINHELQTYTPSPDNVQLTGGSTLQLIPRRNNDSARGWTSGRIESTFTLKPKPGTRTTVEALIRFGDHPPSAKQGIFPSFFAQGDSIRHGGDWPACGEIDILQTINGDLTSYGNAHCDVFPDGRCNEPTGLSGTVEIPGQGWHRWRVVWHREAGCWECEGVVWYMDGEEYWRVEGGDVGDEGVWKSLLGGEEGLFFILKVAVGGDWPGDPNEETLDGYGSMMEVAYVAVSLMVEMRVPGTKREGTKGCRGFLTFEGAIKDQRGT
ncbi:putative endo-1,3(4)-beta-glucanase [Cercophora newfieldiana]|uniref:Endo-1,3(4)-beta-glucanase n=1 Tax=Cercophora newfieldiana TaxID=92897 RepID=A0AA39Y6S5_9PEZI|nr:putative endo-1,3(4)-beta-glucanase [Cercophora newfieldiana]